MNNFGGGLYNDAGATASLTNATISGNTVSTNGNFGGGAYNKGTAEFVNVTTTNNLARFAGGIYNDNPGTFTLKNSITAKQMIDPSGARSADCGGVIKSDGSNLDSDGTCKLTAPGDKPGQDPKLGPLLPNGGPTLTHLPMPGSPVIDAVQNACPPPMTDQRGIMRPQPQGGTCDIGAVEVSK